MRGWPAHEGDILQIKVGGSAGIGAGGCFLGLADPSDMCCLAELIGPSCGAQGFPPFFAVSLSVCSGSRALWLML